MTNDLARQCALEETAIPIHHGKVDVLRRHCYNVDQEAGAATLADLLKAVFRRRSSLAATTTTKQDKRRLAGLP